MRRSAAFLVVCLLVVPTLWAGELAGVKMDDTATVGDSSLELNGMGMRKKMWVKVYVAGLYLESPTPDAATAMSSAGTKRIVMHFLTNKANKKKMDSAWFEGFESNSGSTYSSLEERVRDFADFFGDMKVGDVVELTMIPGAGTTAVLNGNDVGSIDGDDFSQALLGVWLGDHPPTEDLKTGMLGN